ncbi:MAG TPA: addiction module protein [Acidobacteriaceae bacterium]|jgi:putative addiction module component (TIGR02574 family)
MASLEEGGYVTGEFTPTQLAEFERRSEEFRSGKVQGIPWEKLLEEIDERNRRP